MTNSPSQVRAVTTLTAREFLASTPLGSYRMRILFVGFLCVLVDGIDIGVWGFVYPPIIKEWGVSVEQITAVATMGYIALALGAFIAGPLADRFGRKPTLLVSTGMFAVSLLAAGLATNIEMIGLCRVVACAGLGAVMPTALTLVSEYLPAKGRAFLITIMFCGFPLSQTAVGYLAAIIVPGFGWNVLLIIGGIAGAILLALILLFIPESLALLGRTGSGRTKAARILKDLASSVGHTPPTVDTPVELKTVNAANHQSAVRAVLSKGQLFTSCVVWFSYLANCTVTYVIFGYLPLIMAQTGVGAAGSGQILAMNGWGGVIGTLLIGYIMTKTGNFRTIAVSLILTGASISVVAFGNWELTSLIVLGFVWGVLNAGSNGGMNAAATEAFPAKGRATGISWMHAAGKFGAILSGLLGGIMIGAGWGIGAIMISFAFPLLISGTGYTVMAYRNRTLTSN